MSGEYSHLPNPAKIEGKEAIASPQSRSSRLRVAPQVLYKRGKQHDHKTVCSCHVTYAFESESTLYSCLNVKELVARSRCET